MNRESKIQILHSATAGSTPDVAVLDYGELAINIADEFLYFKGSDDLLKTFAGGPTGATGTSVGYTAGNTAPSSANTGDFWYENDTGLYYAYVWDGSTLGWLQISGQDGLDGTDGVTGADGATGTFTVYYSSTGPASPSIGDIWFHSDDGVYSIYINDGDSDQWVEITGKQGPTGSTGPQGIQGIQGNTGPTGEGSAISVAGSTGATTDGVFYDTGSTSLIYNSNLQLTPSGLPFFTQFGETIYDWGGVTTGSTFEVDLSNGLIQHINIGPTGGTADGSTKTFSFTGENGSFVQNIMLAIRGGGGYTMSFTNVTWNDEAGEPVFGATSGTWTFVPFTYVPVDGLGWVGGAQMTVVQ